MIARLFDWLISLYQRAAAGRPSPCRFTPSCSTYAREALATRGALRGSALAVWRILRCNPWGGSGYDPVPQAPAHGESAPCGHTQRSTTLVCASAVKES